MEYFPGENTPRVGLVEEPLPTPGIFKNLREVVSSPAE